MNNKLVGHRIWREQVDRKRVADRNAPDWIPMLQAVGDDLVKKLEKAYDPQNPVPDHPADFVRRYFRGSE